MILTQALFAPLDTKLIELLRSLSADDWDKPTIARLWTVKDIASHLLDTNIRTLSLARDKHTLVPDVEITSYQSLVDYLNKLNSDWVAATKRMSTGMLTEMLESTGKQYSAYMATVDMDANAIFPVAWAGQTTSKNWFHVAREFTEKWHHQQQIRDAVGKPGIMTKEFFYPVMDTFIQALPYTYRDVAAPDGTVIKISIDTPIGGNWYLVRKNAAWELTKQPQNVNHASLTFQPAIAWKLFTKGLTPQAAVKGIDISGDQDLAMHALNLIAVMA